MIESIVACALATAADGLDEARSDGLEARFCAAVRQERLLKTVRELVALGARMGGTPSGTKAAEYHAARFTAAGLEARLVQDPEIEAFQTLALSASVAAGDDALDLVDGCLAQHTPGIEACELEIRTAPPAPGGHDGEPYALLVDESDLRTLSIEGTRAPRVVLVACERRVETSAAVLHQPRRLGATLLSLSARESRWLRERMGGRLATLAIEARVFDGKGSPVTACADLPAAAAEGGAAEAPILLFCAHGDSDSGSPGADDNASGDAVIDELATVFGALAKEGMALPITLRFAVWGSEILSSGAYFDRIRKDGSAARHVAVINFDQAGTGAERDCVYFEPDDLPLNEPLIRLGLRLGADYLGKEGFWTEYVSNAALGGTDSYVFAPGWRRGGAKGDLPALTVFTAAFGSAEEPATTKGFESPGWKGDPARIRVDYSRVYHETGDRPEVTTEAEPWNMDWITKAAGLLGLRLAASPEAVSKLLDR